MSDFTEEELQALRESFEYGMRENGFDDFSFRMTGKMYTHQIVEERFYGFLLYAKQLRRAIVSVIRWTGVSQRKVYRLDLQIL